MLSQNDIKEELSHAYLQAVASSCGFVYDKASRGNDNDGVDGVLRAQHKLAPDSKYTNFPVDVQLKATSRPLLFHDGLLSFSLEKAHYDKLREKKTLAQRILIVLELPADQAAWVTQSTQELVLRRCAFWQSLRGAPPTTNKTAKTVYIPDDQQVSPRGLRELMTRFSLGDVIPYGINEDLGSTGS